uniref:Uncharacterized protein n=1 Tax=Salix viminalis TaxID=40686 RepID=A0A6N2N922_SALVM
MLGPAEKEIRDDSNRRVNVRLEPRDNGVIELGRCCNDGQREKGETVGRFLGVVKMVMVRL